MLYLNLYTSGFYVKCFENDIVIMPPITQNDFLDPLFSLNPFLVALIIWITGFGSLLLIAWRTNSITTILLKNLGFMIGDFIMLPLAGFLITLFYQQINSPVDFIISNNLTYPILVVALIITVLSGYATLFVWKTLPLDISVIPHGIFYFFMTYILLNFFIKGLLQLFSSPTPFLWMLYIGVLFSIGMHLLVPMIYGRKYFPVS